MARAFRRASIPFPPTPGTHSCRSFGVRRARTGQGSHVGGPPPRKSRLKQRGCLGYGTAPKRLLVPSALMEWRRLGGVAFPGSAIFGCNGGLVCRSFCGGGGQCLRAPTPCLGLYSLVRIGSVCFASDSRVLSGKACFISNSRNT